jgi:hypothetical protein
MQVHTAATSRSLVHQSARPASRALRQFPRDLCRDRMAAAHLLDTAQSGVPAQARRRVASRAAEISRLFARINNRVIRRVSRPADHLLGG